MRFPTPQGDMEIVGDQLTAKQCLVMAVKQKAQLLQEPKEGSVKGK